MFIGQSGSTLGKKFAVAVLVLVASAGLLITVPFVVKASGVTQDFASFYAAGQIVREGSAPRLYDTSLEKQFEKRLPPSYQFLAFLHPAYEVLLFTPLTSMPYAKALFVWDAFNLLLLGIIFAFLRLTGYRLDSISGPVWLAASLFPLLELLLFGQDTLLLTLLLFLAFLLLKRKRDLGAGLVFGTALFHFEFILPLIFIFLLRRRWRVLAGFSLSGVVVLLTSIAVVGWSGMLAYGKLLLAAGRMGGNKSVSEVLFSMPSLRGIVGTLLHGVLSSHAEFLIVILGSLGLTCWAAAQFRDIGHPERKGFDLQFSIAVIVALVTSYHLYPYALTPLLVVSFLMLGHESTAYAGAGIRDRQCAQLLLLLFLVPAIGFSVSYSGYSVLFIILAGLLVWLGRENAALRSASLLPHGETPV